MGWKMKVFVNAPLSALGWQFLNDEIARILHDEGFDYYLPQEVFPPGTSISSVSIFHENLAALKDCDVVLSVLDRPGLGVAFELGVAFALGKIVILLRTDKQDYLGKIMEGLWQSTESELRAVDLEELRSVLRRIRSKPLPARKRVSKTPTK